MDTPPIFLNTTFVYISVKPLSDFEDKSLITGVGNICFDCKTESKRKKGRRKYEAKKARRKNNTKTATIKNCNTITGDSHTPSKISFKKFTLKAAFNHHKSIKILYKGQWRMIDPYALNDTYVVAYCHLRNDLRTFRIDKIENLVEAGPFNIDTYLQTTAHTNLKSASNFKY